MTIDIEQLVHSVISENPDSEDAALTLELLIERERVYRPDPNDDGGVREILGEEIAARRLSEAEITFIVDRLLDYLWTADKPPSFALWPVIRSYEARIVPTFLELFTSAAPDESQEQFATGLLYGIITSGMTSDEFREDALRAIQFAAREGASEVRRQARDYLDLPSGE